MPACQGPYTSYTLTISELSRRFSVSGEGVVDSDSTSGALEE